LHCELPRDGVRGFLPRYPYSEQHQTGIGSGQAYPAITAMEGEAVDMPQDDPRRPRSREVTIMNCAGHVLDHGFWVLKGNYQGGGYGPGLGDVLVYDEHNRVIMRKTSSWRAVNADTNSNPHLNGLVYRYAYDDRPN